VQLYFFRRRPVDPQNYALRTALMQGEAKGRDTSVSVLSFHRLDQLTMSLHFPDAAFDAQLL
jgi:cellobiose-specific phosphotransferase system component IIA